jgi:hypothetical protein
MVLMILLGMTAVGSILLTVLLKVPRNDFLPPLCGFVLGAALPPIGGLLWVLVHPAFEQSGIWIWGLIVGVPGAMGGALAGWSQWVSRTTVGMK